jgi:hypothetical protein
MGQMQDKAEIQSGAEGLYAPSGVEAQQARASISALQMIEDMRAKWQDSRSEMDASGTILADKVIAICEVLSDLVNYDAQFISAQRYQIYSMIVAIASSNEQEQIEAPGHGALLCMPLSAFINTCRG